MINNSLSQASLMIRKGYTIIELLIVITISVVVFSVGMAGYREFSRRQALTGILKQIKADLRLAQQLALTGQKPESVVCTQLSSYTFSRITSDNYQLIANCTNANHIVKDIIMPVNTTISAGSVVFKVLGQGTDLSIPLTYTIANTFADTTGQIIIGVGGDVK